MKNTPKTYYATKKRVKNYIKILSATLTKTQIKIVMKKEIHNLSIPENSNPNQIRFFNKVLSSLS